MYSSNNKQLLTE